MRWPWLCLAVAGCARAGEPNRIIGGIDDARPGNGDVPVTLTQTASNAIVPNNSFGCLNTGLTLRNSYYRVFRLADFQITSMFHVTQVDFGVQEATAGQGAATQPAAVHLGTYDGAAGAMLDLALIRPLGSVEIQIPNAIATAVTVPIAADVAPTASVIVELAIPDGTAARNKFLVGTNTADETAPGYTLGPDCGYTTPTSMQRIADDLGFGPVHMVMTITGVSAPAS